MKLTDPNRKTIETANAAFRCGMSYGEYMVALENGKTPEPKDGRKKNGNPRGNTGVKNSVDRDKGFKV